MGLIVARDLSSPLGTRQLRLAVRVRRDAVGFWERRFRFREKAQTFRVIFQLIRWCGLHADNPQYLPLAFIIEESKGRPLGAGRI